MERFREGCIEKGEGFRWHFAEEKQCQPRVHRKTIFIPARDLEITDGDDTSNWQWFALDNGDEVAKLVGDNELDITGEIETLQLTQYPYAVYLVFKLEKNRKNIDEAYAAVGTYDKRKGHRISLARSKRPRKDHWYEVVLGDYRKRSGNELPIHLWGIDESSDKYGIIVKGFEIRAKP